jgi:hypothetical protein
VKSWGGPEKQVDGREWWRRKRVWLGAFLAFVLIRGCVAGLDGESENAAKSSTTSTEATTSTTEASTTTTIGTIPGFSAATIKWLDCDTPPIKEGSWWKCIHTSRDPERGSGSGPAYLRESGAPEDVWGEVRARSDYNEFGSVLYESNAGGVVYIPSLLPFEQATVPGKKPGLTGVDTDCLGPATTALLCT